jgi:hypothetical protein
VLRDRWPYWTILGPRYHATDWYLGGVLEFEAASTTGAVDREAVIEAMAGNEVDKGESEPQIRLEGGGYIRLDGRWRVFGRCGTRQARFESNVLGSSVLVDSVRRKMTRRNLVQ